MLNAFFLYSFLLFKPYFRTFSSSNLLSVLYINSEVILPNIIYTIISTTAMLGCFEAEKYPAKYKSTAKSVPVIWIQFFNALELITFFII